MGIAQSSGVSFINAVGGQWGMGLSGQVLAWPALPRGVDAGMSAEGEEKLSLHQHGHGMQNLSPQGKPSWSQQGNSRRCT